ncbi:MAG: hypothetical protein GKR90_06865 [Pseudomonadales bacterium]|nr:hypothetical protein [Pseudomonadales bacterium]
MATVQIDHLLGKFIVYIGYLLTGVISIEAQNPYFALVFGTALWLFGINSAAYLVEAIRGHTHRHNVL